MPKSYKLSVDSFNKAKQEFKLAEEKFEFEKQKFYKDSNFVFKKFNLGSSVDLLDYNVVKVEKKKLFFDISALKLLLTKSQEKKVLSKTYEISDAKGLFLYLKKIGANPNTVKSFLNVTESVNENALAKMVELGDVEESEVLKCCRIEFQNPYYLVKDKGNA